ncbi:hypothetical protein MCOR33_000247 [Pyricularia grisea]|uniref:Uncharacterized protein n=1 Tax=Pyricularia grisea TaxID=148305 RepID=A0ABQ8P0D8_PYRGI|nr:hypothetical protein MCOR33_000247 [Pyricularia grisea]
MNCSGSHFRLNDGLAPTADNDSMLTIAESSDCPVSSRGGSAEPIETTGRLNTGVASVDARVNEELALSVVGR